MTHSINLQKYAYLGKEGNRKTLSQALHKISQFKEALLRKLLFTRDMESQGDNDEHQNLIVKMCDLDLCISVG